MSDNVIYLDFAKRDDEAKIAEMVRNSLIPVLTQVAERRGYNPTRVNEIATVVGETAKALDRVRVTFSITLPSTDSPEELQKWAHDLARQVAQGVSRHCLLRFVEAIPALCYPPQ